MAPRDQKSKRETSKRIILRIPASSKASSSSAQSNMMGSSELTESSLRSLSRAQLQKLARVRSQIPSYGLLWRSCDAPWHTGKWHPCQLEKRNDHPRFVEATTSRAAEDDPQAGPARKKTKTAKEPPAQLLPTPESQTVALTDDATKRLYEALRGGQLFLPHTVLPTEATSAFQPPVTELQENHAMDVHDDDDLYSASESEGTQITQPDYATPVSSRSSTPELSAICQLERCVHIMQEISGNDQVIIAQIAHLREKAARLRKQTQDIRDVVRAEQGRRERMEAFFIYWTEIEQDWPKKWLWGEAMIPPKYLIPNGGDQVTGPPTLPVGRKQPPAAQPAETTAPATQGWQKIPENAEKQRDEQETHQDDLQTTGNLSDEHRAVAPKQASEMAGGSRSNLSHLPPPRTGMRGTKRKHCS